MIQARGEADGLPAPRHMFDVGVNYVLALLVGRRNNQRAVSMRDDRPRIAALRYIRLQIGSILT